MNDSGSAIKKYHLNLHKETYGSKWIEAVDSAKVKIAYHRKTHPATTAFGSKFLKRKRRRENLGQIRRNELFVGDASAPNFCAGLGIFVQEGVYVQSHRTGYPSIPSTREIESGIEKRFRFPGGRKMKCFPRCSTQSRRILPPHRRAESLGSSPSPDSNRRPGRRSEVPPRVEEAAERGQAGCPYP